MNVGLLITNDAWKDLARPGPVIASVVRSLGHKLHIVAPVTKNPFGTCDLDAVFVWNGRKGLRGEIVKELVDRGARIIFLERGFFDRFKFAQADSEGFNHTASWAKRLREPAPACGADRLAFLGIEPKQQTEGPKDGYALVIGQTPGDAQLDGEAVQPESLLHLVEAANPMIEVRYRPHPNVQWTERTLEEDLAGASFCITINSNAGNEALIAGVPVLSLGDSLYARAGVAFRGAPATLIRDMADMRHGWRPDAGEVTNYLRWLACRQYSNADLADGAVIFAAVSGLDPWLKGVEQTAPGQAGGTAPGASSPVSAESGVAPSAQGSATAEAPPATASPKKGRTGSRRAVPNRGGLEA